MRRFISILCAVSVMLCMMLPAFAADIEYVKLNSGIDDLEDMLNINIPDDKLIAEDYGTTTAVLYLQHEEYGTPIEEELVEFDFYLDYIDTIFVGEDETITTEYFGNGVYILRNFDPWTTYYINLHGDGIVSKTIALTASQQVSWGMVSLQGVGASEGVSDPMHGVETEIGIIEMDGYIPDMSDYVQINVKLELSQYQTKNSEATVRVYTISKYSPTAYVSQMASTNTTEFTTDENGEISFYVSAQGEYRIVAEAEDCYVEFEDISGAELKQAAEEADSDVVELDIAMTPVKSSYSQQNSQNLTDQNTASSHSTVHYISADHGYLSGQHTQETVENGQCPQNIPTPVPFQNYQFQYWIDQDGWIISDPSRLMITDDVWLYACFVEDAEYHQLTDYEEPSSVEEENYIFYAAETGGRLEGVTYEQVAYGESPKDVPIPVKKLGFQFTGWINQYGETIKDPDKMKVTEETWLYACFELMYPSTLESHTVYYWCRSNGYLSSISLSETITDGDTPRFVPLVSANEGYVFVGWSDQNGNFVKYPETLCITEDIWLEAKFVPAEQVYVPESLCSAENPLPVPSAAPPVFSGNQMLRSDTATVRTINQEVSLSLSETNGQTDLLQLLLVLVILGGGVAIFGVYYVYFMREKHGSSGSTPPGGKHQ